MIEITKLRFFATIAILLMSAAGGVDTSRRRLRTVGTKSPKSATKAPGRTTKAPKSAKASSAASLTANADSLTINTPTGNNRRGLLSSLYRMLVPASPTTVTVGNVLDNDVFGVPPYQLTSIDLVSFSGVTATASGLEISVGKATRRLARARALAALPGPNITFAPSGDVTAFFAASLNGQLVVDYTVEDSVGDTDVGQVTFDLTGALRFL